MRLSKKNEDQIEKDAQPEKTLETVPQEKVPEN